MMECSRRAVADLKEVKRPFPAPVFCGGALLRFASSMSRSMQSQAFGERLYCGRSPLKSPPLTLVLSFQTRLRVQPSYYCSVGHTSISWEFFTRKGSNMHARQKDSKRRDKVLQRKENISTRTGTYRHNFMIFRNPDPENRGPIPCWKSFFLG